MGTAYASFYDLVRLREMGPETKDWHTTDKNFQILSLVLKAFENHKHTGAPGLPPPSRVVTISIANPAVITLTGHGYVADNPVIFYSTGFLPTGLTPGTTYYVLASGLTSNTFRVSDTIGGTAIQTTGTQFGIQSVPMQPALSETTGGILAPGSTVGVRLSYLNTAGLETQATVEKDITLSSAVTKPLTPTLTIINPQPSAISGGTYMYVMTKVKGGGETVASDALPVTIAYDQTYEVSVAFDAISSYIDGTTQLNIYRSSGLNSTFQLVAEITDTSATGYTDDNTFINQTQQPPGTSTFDNDKAVLINWSALGSYSPDAVTLNIYVTQQLGIWGTNSFLTSISLTTSPPTSYTYLGSEALSAGFPYDSTQIPSQPGVIDNSQATTGLGGTGGIPTPPGVPPVGAQVPYTGSGDPPAVSGLGLWVIADGRLINATTYSTFFGGAGHAYNGGVDPGGGMVRIPDKRGAGSVGSIDMGTGAGANDNAHVQATKGTFYGEVAHTLSTGEIASHTHSGSTSSDNAQSSQAAVLASGSPPIFTANTPNTGTTPVPAAAGVTWGGNQGNHHHTFTTDGGSVGSGGHNTVEPNQADSWIVRII